MSATVPTTEEALQIARRFIAGHFGNPGEHPRIRIPADPTRDDDLRLTAFITAAGAEIERLRAAHAWQPIETAPRDGTPVDLWGSERGAAYLRPARPGHRRFADCRYTRIGPTPGDGTWAWWSPFEGEIKATHWRRHPGPPETEASDA